MDLNKTPSALVVDDNEDVRFTLGGLLTNDGYSTRTAASRNEALALFEHFDFDLAFVDTNLRASNGIDLLRDIKKRAPATRVIMITSRPDAASASLALRLGAFDYLAKPIRHETLVAVARDGLKNKRAADKLERYRANLEAAFHSVPDVVVAVDSSERLTLFNAAAGATCGYDKTMIGCPLHATGPRCAGACQQALRDTLRSSTPQKGRRFECHTADGACKVVNFTATPLIEPDGHVSGAVAVIRSETRYAEHECAKQERSRFYGLIGRNAAMQKLYSLIEALADVQTTVLINGESGTGKELVASALHIGGNRRNNPFVKLNCSALSEHLLESELFGHVRGAFTGAIATKTGRFQKADGGTIFLDEIGDISPAMQMRLLRVLQERVVERVGDSTPIKVDVRVIAATNQDLAEKVRQGTFRRDLYYRLNIIRLIIPPLRERIDDLPLLTAHFLKVFNAKFSRTIRALSDDVMALFFKHDWPGNVRELEHAIEHAFILCRSDIITVADLPQDLPVLDRATTRSPPGDTIPATRQRLTIEEALAIANGNKSRAARLLGISRRTVYRHLPSP